MGSHRLLPHHVRCLHAHRGERRPVLGLTVVPRGSALARRTALAAAPPQGKSHGALLDGGQNGRERRHPGILLSDDDVDTGKNGGPGGTRRLQYREVEHGVFAVLRHRHCFHCRLRRSCTRDVHWPHHGRDHHFRWHLLPRHGDPASGAGHVGTELRPWLLRFGNANQAPRCLRLPHGCHGPGLHRGALPPGPRGGCRRPALRLPISARRHRHGTGAGLCEAEGEHREIREDSPATGQHARRQ
mmetsp:Transcript_9483/g.25438  ORF Transcript_9483/g.25438 Transcript_9483/m.25438 type:complete len:243 (+) Transcript_9483:408-1136(+)